MADKPNTQEEQVSPEVASSGGPSGGGGGLDQGTYQVIRQRLDVRSTDLRARIKQLNEARHGVFGGIETELLQTDRVTTAHNCVPRDMVAVGDRFIFGFNVQFGLKQEIAPEDVLAVYRFADGTFHAEPLEILGDKEFTKDFKDLYRYYKSARFAKFFRMGPYIHMKFHVGTDPDDFKTFKWALEQDPASSEGGGGTKLVYVDNRSDHEVRYPKQSPFDWQRATREMQRSGRHAHVSIEDKLFIECTGGDLTLKVEDNTEVGQGIYSEPVDNPDQTLDDAEIHYAIQGPMIILKVRPFQERQDRYLIFNTKTQEVLRQDAIATACQLLPEEHGIVFPTGFALASGLHQDFPEPPEGSLYERTVSSPNGEDTLFIFYHRQRGVYTLLSYNLISQTIATPLVCSGYCMFADGTVALFKAGDEPQRHHAVQIWKTPYHSADHEPETSNKDSMLYRIGNRDIVRGMAECSQLLQLIDRQDLYQDLYVDIVQASADISDAYYWLDEADCFELGGTVRQIREAAEAAVGAYEKLRRTQKATQQSIDEAARDVDLVSTENAARLYNTIEPFVQTLADLRRVRGVVIGLRDLKYADGPRIQTLEEQIAEETEVYSRRTVEFLLKPEALVPYQNKAKDLGGQIEALAKVTDAKALAEEVDQAADELQMLIDTVSNLEIDDATQRTAIIDGISTVFATLNAARSGLRNKQKSLGQQEGLAEFASQLKLLSQAVVNYLDLCDTPETTDNYLTKVMVQVEELEGRFAEFDDFIVQLAEKRDEVMTAFETKKLQLVEQRNKRTQALADAADRVLSGIEGRVKRMESVEAINTYLAGDLMVDKARGIVEQLKALDDTVKADDIHSRLKMIREDAVRQLKDKLDLSGDGKNTIRFGRHVFSVNTQPIDLTTVVRDEVMNLHLSGTRFFAPIDDASLNESKAVWDQDLISENRAVYRAEFLAYRMLLDAAASRTVAKLAQATDEELLAHTQAFMAPRYSEAYTKGVHDADATKIFRELLDLSQTVELLRYPTQVRAMASLFWQTPAPGSKASDSGNERAYFESQLEGFGHVVQLFPDSPKQSQYIRELADAIHAFAAQTDVFDEALAPYAAEYLFYELTDGDPAQADFVASPEAADLVEHFHDYLKANGATATFRESIQKIDDKLRRYLLIRDWVMAYTKAQESTQGDEGNARAYTNEAATLLLEGIDRVPVTRIVQATVRRTIQSLVGGHGVITDGTIELDYNAFFDRLNEFDRHTVPAFEQFQAAKKRVVDQTRRQMRIEEFKPKVLTSFVRNKLVDSVFLPLIGDNLAKQMGTVGENTRTDRMGLLLLISPPGYGKTTLMEYIAARLGVAFVKINGPAMGHAVTSLDPQEAPNAAAKQEIKKLNLAFEMGDNVLIYVDDIQHTNPEFLQKFISLCDGTRRIEGVYNGQTRTYDLRGRKVAVVMAGNPYTESGEKFRLPDMLTNRADTYNLGDIIGEHGEAFKTSYLENALTSNPTLNDLAARSQDDVYKLIKIAETGSREGIEFAANFTTDQVDEMVNVMKKLMAVRDVILAVNMQYIASAGQEDQYRTEPAFLLQGSYRNMNRIAEKIVPVMNDDELQSLIVATYEQDAQTLTTGAEANLLKFKEMLEIITPEEAERWDAIKKTFTRNNSVKALGGEEKTAAVITQLASMAQGIGELGSVIGQRLTPETNEEPPIAEWLQPTIQDAVQQLAESQQAVASGMAKLNLQSGFDTDTLQAFQKLTENLGQLANKEQPAAPTTQPTQPTQPAPPHPETITGESSPYEIKVINKIPETFLLVMKQQFDLMKAWLEPMTRINASQDEDIRRIREAIDTLVDKYEHMINKLESTRHGKN